MDLEKAYEILSLPYGTPLKEVKKAFREEAQIHHPDRFSNAAPELQERSEEQFKLLNEAYHTINEYYEQNPGTKPPPRQRPAPRTSSQPRTEASDLAEQEIFNRLNKEFRRESESTNRDLWMLLILMFLAFGFGALALKSCATEPTHIQTQ